MALAQKTDETKSVILADLPAYRDAIYAVLSSSLTDTSSTFDAARLKEVVKFALAAVRTTTAVSDAARTATLWRASEFAELVESFKASERFKNAVAIHNMLKQLVTLAGGAVAKSGKRKNEEGGKKVEKKARKEKKREPEAEVEVEVEDEEVVEEEKFVKEGKKDKKEKKGKGKGKKEGREKKT